MPAVRSTSPAFRQLASRQGLVLIEDAAHALGAAIERPPRRRDRAISPASAFYATKNLTTGEGGMVTTDSAEWADRIRVASLHGMSRDGWARYAREGDAALRRRRGRLQVQHDGHPGRDRPAAARALRRACSDRRAAIWRDYDEALAALPVTRPLPRRAAIRSTRVISTRFSSTRTSAAATRDELVRGAARARHRHERPLPRAAPASVLRALRLSPRHVPERRDRLGSHAVAAAVGGDARTKTWCR